MSPSKASEAEKRYVDQGNDGSGGGRRRTSWEGPPCIIGERECLVSVLAWPLITNPLIGRSAEAVFGLEAMC